jgi:hypothetical protein
MSTPTRPPILIQDPQPVKPVYVADETMPAKGPHTYEGREQGYVARDYAHQEYPKMLYRLRTAEELQYERDNTPLDVWRDKETDLLMLTGHNQRKDIKSYEAWINRHVDITVKTEKEEREARKESFMPLAELAKEKETK